MIFTRRALQRRLNELRAPLGHEAVTRLAARLNKPGKDRLATMWEVVVLHALSGLGTLHHEKSLGSGRQPDIAFDDGTLSITADVTTISDESLHKQNPWQDLSALIEKEKGRLGLPTGGLELRIESKTHHTSRGPKIVLLLPERKHLLGFVREKVLPLIKSQLDQGVQAPSVFIEDESVAIQVSIDPQKSPYSSTSFTSYDTPTIRDRNPLYNALHAKADQLRGADDLVGVIVGDGNTKTLAVKTGVGTFDGRAIANEFLRQHPSVHFVLLLSVREKQFTWYRPVDRERWIDAQLVFSRIYPQPTELEPLLRRMLDAFPQPVQMPVNAAHRAKEHGFEWGHHGGFTMSEDRLRVSAREVLELLAGRTTAAEINHRHDQVPGGASSSPDTLPRRLEMYLNRGQLPSSISIIKTGENDSDDWIEFEFGPPDPAITPFR